MGELKDRGGGVMFSCSRVPVMCLKLFLQNSCPFKNSLSVVNYWQFMICLCVFLLRSSCYLCLFESTTTIMRIATWTSFLKSALVEMMDESPHMGERVSYVNFGRENSAKLSLLCP